MSKPDEKAPAPVRPPTLPPDFPDIPQNPSSDLQPAHNPHATPDQVAGASPGSSSSLLSEESAEALRGKNARLREKISGILEHHPELRDSIDQIAFHQDLHVQLGSPFLERIQANLQERARAIIERRPDLEHLFEE
jgi:hypothetical protein